jgi:protease-4
VPGLVLEGAWLTQAREGRVGISLLGTGGGLHARSAYDDDGHRIAGTWTVSSHGGEDRTVFHGGHATRLAAVFVGGVLGDDALAGASLVDGTSRTVASRAVHEQLARALEDPLTRGVLLEVSGAANMAQIEELRPRLERLRRAGKPVVAYLEYGGGRSSLYLASACDRIVASPEGRFTALGLMSDKHYYRRALADLGLRLDRASYGKYKSAYREYSTDSSTAPDRESIEYQLDTAQELFVSSVTADRKIGRDRLLTALDGRSWRPEDLARLGVIDSVGYREDALKLLGRMARVGPKPRTVRYPSRPQARVAWTLPSRIAIVYASGAIETGRSGNDLLLGPYLGSTTLVQQVEAAFRRRDVRAVVLRVESPGGSSLASDLMFHALTRMKRETKKPLIVSMGSVAASGGYEIAVPGDRIFADRFTRTGSIGVLFVRPSLQGFFQQHHARQEVFLRGDAMPGWSLGRDWDTQAQAAADSAIRNDYADFVERVAQARRMPFADVDRVAQGRVWYAGEALKHGLVDEIGGLEAAVAEARRRAGVAPGERIRPIEYRRPQGSLLERAAGSFLREQWERSAHLPEAGQAMRWEDDALEP